MCVVVFYFIFVEFLSDSLFLQVLSAFKMWTTRNICTHITMNRACIFEEVRTLMDILLDAMCFCRTCNAFNMLEIVFDRKQYETDGFGTVHTTTRSTTTTTSPTTSTSIAEYTMNIEYRALKNDGRKFKSLPHHQFQKVRLYMFRMQKITYGEKKIWNNSTLEVFESFQKSTHFKWFNLVWNESCWFPFGISGKYCRKKATRNSQLLIRNILWFAICLGRNGVFISSIDVSSHPLYWMTLWELFFIQNPYGTYFLFKFLFNHQKSFTAFSNQDE